MEQHIKYMRHAINIGELGRYTSAPNPWVGAVIVKDDKIIGEGHHHKAGTPHAEIMAINDAINRGHKDEIFCSTIYVTLEPCCHQGRTGPCTKQLIEYKFKTIVIAQRDPDVNVSGKGIQLLKESRIEVIENVCQEEAQESLRAYLHHRINKRPYVIAKIGQSIDSKIACEDNTSKWITCQESRDHANKILRGQSGAIIVGSNTFLADNPLLTVRDEAITSDPDFKQPLRTIIDRRGRLMEIEKLHCNKKNTLIFTENILMNLESTYFEEHLTLEKVLDVLGGIGVLQVLVEGGAELLTSFIKNNLVNELYVYTAPTFIGSSGKSIITSEIAKTITETKKYKLKKLERIGDDILSVYALF